MAQTIGRLSAIKVAKIKGPPGYFADGANLYLRVAPGGSRGWIFRFTIGGRTRDNFLCLVWHTVPVQTLKDVIEFFGIVITAIKLIKRVERFSSRRRVSGKARPELLGFDG